MIRNPVHRFAAASVALVVLAVLVVAVVPIAGASAAGGSAKVSLRRTSLGMILVNGRGRTLYAFSRDSRDRDRCVSTPGCTSAWPVVTSRSRPRAGAGVKGSLLSTIKLPGGSRQVTYAGHPLYTYVGDSSAGETDYVGATAFGGTWPAVNRAGKLIR